MAKNTFLEKVWQKPRIYTLALCCVVILGLMLPMRAVFAILFLKKY